MSQQPGEESAEASARARDARTREAEGAREAVLRATAAAPGEESLGAVAERVARAVAQAEPAEQRRQWTERFARWIGSADFLPSIPTLANAGRMGQLAACFVLEASDSLDSIYSTLGRAARIQQGSGGVGIHFSKLRPRNTPIASSGGVSPGPVAFLEVFAESARVNALAGRRPGAHLGVLRDDHPDVLEFVRAKAARPEAFSAIGFAIGVSDALLDEARRDALHVLRGTSGSEAGRVRARLLLEEVARAIHATGNPTLLFLDAIQAANPAPHLGPIEATNPCGEQPLLPDETCVLGSLHLPAFAGSSGALDRERLRAAVRDAIRFLDDVVEVNSYPDAEIARSSRRTRKIGLGLMGFADWLLLCSVRYGGAAAEKLAGEVIELVAESARAATEILAAERGPYPAARGAATRRRNATLLAIAPTGTLRLIAGCSGGLEPFLQPVLRVRTSEGTLRWEDVWLRRWLEVRTREPNAVLDALEAGVPWTELPALGPEDRGLLRRAWEVPPEEQIAIQARFQSRVDGAVSKTVHLPSAVTPERVVELIRLARDSGCKGLALFRRSGEGACHGTEVSPWPPWTIGSTEPA